MRSPLLLILALLSLGLCTACADKHPPTFQGDAALTLEAATPTTLNISWPSAQDDREVRAYRVFRDDEQIAELPASVHAYVIEELQPGTDYLVGVVPVDQADNAGERLSLVASTADGEPPSFPAASSLRIRDVTPEGATEGGGSLELTWPAATDATGVVRYTITHEGQPVGRVEGTELSYRVNAEPGQELEGAYGVTAEDEAGNRSAALAGRFPALELEAPTNMAQNDLPPPDSAAIANQPHLRLNPSLSRALRPANLRRIRLLGGPALRPSLLAPIMVERVAPPTP
ncbi:MAG: fibronectin type III domain-containing protein [Deltaproteobacteria bacterium]|nr:fibronectin type III domain-containing protein [Deltaproteobacteria bacterium]